MFVSMAAMIGFKPPRKAAIPGAPTDDQVPQEVLDFLREMHERGERLDG